MPEPANGEAVHETPRNATVERLTPAQDQVFAALLVGCSITRAAARARVDRSTVHRWLRDPDFVAELHGRQNEFRDARQARVVRSTRKPCRTIEQSITDPRIALAILKGVGVLSGEPPRRAVDDPNEIRADVELRALVNSLPPKATHGVVGAALP